MQLRDLIGSMPVTVAQVTPRTRMPEAAAEMARQKITAILVGDGLDLSGILTCADVIHWFVYDHASPMREVGSVISTRVLRVPAGRTVDEAIAGMTTDDIEHLAVVEGDHVIGLMHLKDLLKEQARLFSAEIEHLHDYISTLHTASRD